MSIKYYLLFLVVLFSFKSIQSGFFTNLLDPKKSICTTKLECLKDALIKKSLCVACRPLVSAGRKLIKDGKYSKFEKIFVLACTGTKSSNSDMCKKLYATYSDSLYKVSLQSTLSNEEICNAWFGCETVKNPLFTWDISLPYVAKPQVTKLNVPQAGISTIRILHLADIHVDYDYKPGSLADCDQYICCRDSSTSVNTAYSSSRRAGYWGDYRNCDLPLWTLENMFKQISKNEKFDIIYWTGDFSPHDVSQNSRLDQITAIKNLTQLFKKYFSNMKIFSSIGNHESIPANLFPTSNNQGNISWLYNTLSEEWVKVGLSNETIINIQKGAFYTTLLYPGLRLISLNNMYCYKNNFWLYVNSTDPLGQLSWLARTLQASENIGEKVHIIAHINPSGCMKSFSRNYYKIVNRYESTIRGQFFGHTHYDEFEIFYDLNDKKRPTNVAYIAGSTTTYRSFNPSYRIYTVDGFYNKSSFQVLDYDTTIMNVTEANLGSGPIWRKEYSAKSAFSLNNLLPDEWNNLVNNVYKNLNGPLFEKLYKYYYKSNANLKSCDSSCRRSFVCSFKQASSEKFIPC